MKKYIALLLTLILLMSLTACGTKEGSVQGETLEPEDTASAPASENEQSQGDSAPIEEKTEEKPDPYEFIGDYVGIYRITEIDSDGMDLTEVYQKGWEDKSLYYFIYITDKCEFKQYMYRNTNGEDELTEVSSIFFNPTNKCLYTNQQQMEWGTAKGEPVSIENGVITIEEQGSHMVFEYTDEIPFPED